MHQTSLGSPVGSDLDRAVAPPTTARLGFVVRDRLLRQLLAYRSETVILVDGPAGSGKSTLAGQWKDHDDRVHVGVSISQAMDDPAVLAEQVVTALETIAPSARKTRSIITGSEPTFSAILLPALTSLAAGRGRPYVIVVDDVHLLQHKDCQRILAAVAYGVPQGSALAVLSRERSPGWLAVIRGDGQLFELGRDELAFDASEAAALFAAADRHISEPAVTRAVEASGGWPVALYLSAMSLRRRNVRSDSVQRAIPRGSESHMRDYIRSQILEPLDQGTRDFLVRTAIIDDLSPALCDAILDRRDSAAKLAWLQDHIQLGLELDPERHRVRLHHLLSETLLAELQTREAELVPTLHRRAAQWYERRGDLDAAIRHAHKCGDLALLGSLVWSGVPVCVGSGWPDRLRQWLAPLSDEDIASDRWLALSAVWYFLQAGDQVRMGRWLPAAEEHAGQEWRDHTSTDEYAASLAVTEALVGRRGMGEVRLLADAALRGLPAASPFRTAAAFIRGVAFTLDGGVDEGTRSLQEAVELSRSLGVAIVEADALSWLGLLHLVRGETSAGLGLLDAAADVLSRNDLESLATSAHSLTAQALGQALTQDPRAPATLAKARRKSVLIEGIAPWFTVAGRLVQARAAIVLGERALARLLASDARARMTPDLQSSLFSRLLREVEEQLQLLDVEGISAASLTAAELRVLQFLPSHLNYPQIGERLFVSQNTIKTHALSIYRKFGVSTRADAVARGRTLGLLDEPVLE
jgi:LuxR family transcriptional regulator, maltose regulon positive regulatory protein